MNGRILTAKMLTKAGACPGQVGTFRALFGSKCVVTPELAVAVRDTLRVNFLIYLLPTNRQRDSVWKKLNAFGEELRVAREAELNRFAKLAGGISKKYSEQDRATTLHIELASLGERRKSRLLDLSNEYNIQVAKYCAERFIKAGQKASTKSQKGK